MDQLLKHLTQYAKLETSIDVERFEATLQQISELNHPEAIGLLIPFFDDKCRFPEVMFSIVHAIERFDSETYVRELLKSLPAFIERSPYWATVIHLRILNTPNVLRIYCSQVKDAERAIKVVSRGILEKIRDTKPKFSHLCTETLLHAFNH